MAALLDTGAVELLRRRNRQIEMLAIIWLRHDRAATPPTDNDKFPRCQKGTGTGSGLCKAGRFEPNFLPVLRYG